MSEKKPNSPPVAPMPYSPDYPPPDFIDPVIEAYKKDVDRTILRENLKLTVEGRFQKYKSFLVSRAAWAGAASRGPAVETSSHTSGGTR